MSSCRSKNDSPHVCAFKYHSFLLNESDATLDIGIINRLSATIKVRAGNPDFYFN